jgi:hypothetical protein
MAQLNLREYFSLQNMVEIRFKNWRMKLKWRRINWSISTRTRMLSWRNAPRLYNKNLQIKKRKCETKTAHPSQQKTTFLTTNIVDSVTPPKSISQQNSSHYSKRNKRITTHWLEERRSRRPVAINMAAYRTTGAEGHTFPWNATASRCLTISALWIPRAAWEKHLKKKKYEFDLQKYW